MRVIRLADTVGFRLSGPETAQSEIKESTRLSESLCACTRTNEWAIDQKCVASDLKREACSSYVSLNA